MIKIKNPCLDKNKSLHYKINIEDCFYEVIPAKNNQLSIKCNGNTIHSLYSPDKEAAKLSSGINLESASIIVIIGFGFAYHIEKILMKIKDYQIPVIIFPLDENIFEIARYHIDLSFLKSDNVHIVNSKSDLQILPNILKRFPVEKFRGYQIVELAGECRLHTDKVCQIKQFVNKQLSDYLYNQFTSLEMTKLWTWNVISNIPKIIRQDSAQSMICRIKDNNVLIAAAGPSLDHSLPEIHKYSKDNGLIFCVDTAVRNLLEYGIIPDVVVSLDAQIHNFKDFSLMKNLETSFLLCDVTCYPRIPRDFPGKVLFFKSNAPGLYPEKLTGFIEEKLECTIPEILAGGSVLNSTIDIAYRLGAQNIILAGADFSYFRDKSHATATPVYYHNLINTNRFNQFPSIIHNQILQKNITEVYAGKENPVKVQSEPVLSSFKKWIEDYILLYKDACIINTGRYGLNISGACNLENIDQITSDHINSDYENASRNKSAICFPDTREVESPSVNNISDELNSLYNQISALEKEIKRKISDSDCASYTEVEINRISDKYSFITDYLYKEHLLNTRFDDKAKSYVFSVLSSLLKLNKKIMCAVKKIS